MLAYRSKGDEDLMVITDTGVMIPNKCCRYFTNWTSSTMGVKKVMRLDENTKVSNLYEQLQQQRKEEVEAEHETESEKRIISQKKEEKVKRISVVC